MKSRFFHIGLIVALMAILCVTVLVLAQDQATEVLRAQKFELVDSTNKVIAILAPDMDDNASLILRDRFGHNRVSIAMKNETVSIQCFGATGEVTGSLPGTVPAVSASAQSGPANVVVYTAASTPKKTTLRPKGGMMGGMSGSNIKVAVTVHPNIEHGLVNGYTVGGLVTNISDKTYKQVILSINYYDKAGKLVHSEDIRMSEMQRNISLRLNHYFGNLENGARIASCTVDRIQAD